MRRFIRAKSGTLLDIDRIDGVMCNTNDEWVIMVNGLATFASKEFANWVANKISEGASIEAVPSEIVLTPPSDD